METSTHGNPVLAALSTSVSILSATISVITLPQAQAWMTLFGSGIAIVSGFFAIRYYFYATKKLKNGNNKKLVQ